MKKLELFLAFILVFTLYDNSKQSGYSALDDFDSDTISIIPGGDYGDNLNGTGTKTGENEEKNGIYFLGFGKYERKKNKITFRIYFLPIDNRYLGDEIEFTLIIFYSNRLRVLEEEKEEVSAVCKQNDDAKYDRINFDCEASVTKDKNIKSIISKRDYSYDRSDAIHIFESSNAINVNIAEETEAYLENDLFELKDGILMKDGYSFTIEGTIKEENGKPFSEENVTLILNDAENKKKIQCEVDNFTTEYYDIKCTLNESIIDANLHRSFCFGKYQNLFINMRRINQNMSYVINGTNIIDKIASSSSSSKGLSVGAFVGIILPCVIVVIAGLTFGYVYLTKPKEKNHITKDSGEVFDSGIQMNE